MWPSRVDFYVKLVDKSVKMNRKKRGYLSQYYAYCIDNQLIKILEGDFPNCCRKIREKYRGSSYPVFKATWAMEL